MRIGIAAVGSRGDVQPYVALGRGLRRAGHDVRLLVDRYFGDLVRGAGLELAPVAADPAAALADDLAAIGDNPLRLFRWFRRHLTPIARSHFQDVRDASEGLDALLHSALALAVPHVAEWRGIPSLATYVQPLSETGAFASPMMSRPPAWAPMKRVLNRLGYRFGDAVIFRLVRGVLNECRRDILGQEPLPPGYFRSLQRSRWPILYGYSPSVLPKPADWGDWLHVTGYWFLDADPAWAPPRGLQEFLDAGPPPVYVGFGSMGGSGSEDATGLAVEALRLTGARGILLGTGAAGVTRVSDAVLSIPSVPHDWIFPRCAAVVHHGGAGTTAAGLRAGVPAVTVPFFADQFFWGWRLADLGAAAPPIRRRMVTPARLAAAIRLVTESDSMRAAARELGGRIRSEDGVANAVGLIERLLIRRTTVNS